MSNVATYAPADSFLVPSTMAEAMKLAEVMATGRLVPKHLQGSVGDCLMVIEQARRWRMSPFAVAQATSLINGKLMYEGKLVAAAIETSGAIIGYLDYKFDGIGDSLKVTVSATRRGDDGPRKIDLALKDARTDNRQWIVQPEQMLCYSGARVWGRRWTPAVMLGVYSPEEFVSGQLNDPSIIEGKAEPVAQPLHTPPPPPPEYNITLPNGQLYTVNTGTEWIDAWHGGLKQLGKDIKRIKAVHAANRRHLMNVSTFDPAAAAEIEQLLNFATEEPK